MFSYFSFHLFRCASFYPQLYFSLHWYNWLFIEAAFYSIRLCDSILFLAIDNETCCNVQLFSLDIPLLLCRLYNCRYCSSLFHIVLRSVCLFGVHTSFAHSIFIHFSSPSYILHSAHSVSHSSFIFTACMNTLQWKLFAMVNKLFWNKKLYCFHEELFPNSAREFDFALHSMHGAFNFTAPQAQSLTYCCIIVEKLVRTKMCYFDALNLNALLQAFKSPLSLSLLSVGCDGFNFLCSSAANIVQTLFVKSLVKE